MYDFWCKGAGNDYPKAMKDKTRAELKKSAPIYTSLLLSGCLGPKGIPNSSQTNSQQPAVSLGFLTVFMLLVQINNSFLSQCLQSKLYLEKPSNLLGLLRNLQNRQAQKSYFLMVKTSVNNLRWVYLRIGIRWVREDTSFHFFQDCLCIYFLLCCLGSTHSYKFQVRLQWCISAVSVQPKPNRGLQSLMHWERSQSQ